MSAFQHDAFLTDVIEKPVWKVCDAGLLNSDCLQTGDLHSGFAYGQADCGDASASIRFQEFGFHLVDTNVQLIRPLKIDGAPSSNVESKTDDGYCIRLARDSDEFLVGELAASSFHLTRFHLDPGVPNATANEIKRRWATNFFAGQRGEKMIVIEHLDQVIGFLLLLERDTELIIDLIAVAQPHQGKKLAGRMIQFAEKRCNGCRQYRVGTQIANVRSLRAYQRLGFKISSSAYVFHYHGDIPNPVESPDLLQPMQTNSAH